MDINLAHPFNVLTNALDLGGLTYGISNGHLEALESGLESTGTKLRVPVSASFAS